MGNLIDAFELTKHIKFFRDDQGQLVGTVLVKDILKAERIDAQPIVHAHWIKKSFRKNPNGHEMDGNDEGFWLRQCSNCHMSFEIFSRYCPECGAKME